MVDLITSDRDGCNDITATSQFRGRRVRSTQKYVGKGAAEAGRRGVQVSQRSGAGPEMVLLGATSMAGSVFVAA